jgi:hypothetical protein
MALASMGGGVEHAKIDAIGMLQILNFRKSCYRPDANAP